MRERLGHGGWDDEDEDNDAAEPLTPEEASRLRARLPSVSPWQVVAAQAVVGGVVALFAGLVTGELAVVRSALYGALVAVVPGALMARGATRRAPKHLPALSAVSLMSWSMVKLAVSVALLGLAPKLVQPLSWPALLVALALCIQVYWFALLWRGRVGSS